MLLIQIVQLIFEEMCKQLSFIEKFLPKWNGGLPAACGHVQKLCIAEGGKTQDVMCCLSSVRKDYE